MVSVEQERKIQVIVTGSTGMVGEGVLHICLNSPEVERVIALNRRPCGVTHPKLTEILHPDFFDLTQIESQLGDADACFFCLGVTSIGLTEPEYSRLTYDLTIHAGEVMLRTNPEMVFCYVTGKGTDSSEQGKSMWARVKGKTENRLLQMGFKGVYLFRPGYIHPIKGMQRTHKFYYSISWLYPVLSRLFSKHTNTLDEIGRAMINAAKQGNGRAVLECEDIRKLAAVRGI
jgi:uncharacterized protein YbjT (DUF2867 family)